MARKQKELPGVVGDGVAPIVIEEIEKAISKYEKRKEARCAESPAEVAAKRELKLTLQRHKDELPMNGEGTRFYCSEDRDYLLEEKLTVKKHADAEEDE